MSRKSEATFKKPVAGGSDQPPAPQFEKLEDRLLLSLLGMSEQLGPPEVSYDTTGTVAYSAAADSFDVDAAPLSLVLEVGQRPLRIIDPRDLQLHIQIDGDGNLIGGVAGNDLYLLGKVMDRNNVVYDGVLLTGEVVAYGELNAGDGTNADRFDFRFTPTGGLLMSFFDGYDIGIDMTVSYWPESTPYAGSFAVDFDGHAQGVMGVVEQLPPPPPASTLSGSVTVDGAAGLAGVSVSLTGDGVNLSTVTDENGNYSFGDLAAGTYSVSAAQPDGLLDGDETAGTLGGTVGDDVISQITLAADQDATGYVFNELTPSVLNGSVIAEGVGLPGVAVNLTGLDDRGAAVSLSTITGEGGSFSFVNLRPGTYAIAEAQPGAYLDGDDAAGSLGGTVADDLVSDIAVASAQTGAGYLFQELTPSVLSGAVTVDGVGLAGVTITLTGTDDRGQAVSLTTTTGTNGSYSFGSLRPGTYAVAEAQQPAGYLDGDDSAGSLGGTVADDLVSDVAVASAQNGTGYLFNELTPSSLGGAVTVDGVGLAGVTVTLTGTDDRGQTVSLTTTTGTDGSYSFGSLRPGTYAIAETQPEQFLDGDDAAGTLGGTVADDLVSDIVLASNQNGTGYAFSEIQPVSISGFVWEDFNDDGEIDFDEAAIPNVTVTLTGVDDRGNAVELTTVSDEDGVYFFTDLRPGTYTVAEAQPAGFVDGQDALGSAGGVVSNDQFSQVALAAGTDAVDYNFGERPGPTGRIRCGQTASIGFWHGKKGQKLLKALNGGQNATQLGNWLAATFPNMFGDLAGKTNAQVVDVYLDTFQQKKGNCRCHWGWWWWRTPLANGKLDSQVMATAFAVYVTNATLAGNTATAYGFRVTEDGVGAATVNVGFSGAAFDVANFSTITVMDALLATEAHTVYNGILYSYEVVKPDGTVCYGIDYLLRVLANEVYTRINEAGHID